MNPKLIFLCIVCSLISICLQGQPKNQKDAKGRKQGYWEAVDSNGKLVYTGYFKDGQPVGIMKRYFPSGTVRVIMNYGQNSKKVRARFFYQNEKPAATGNYIDTKRDSTWTYYSYYTNTVSHRSEYKQGIRHGMARSYYPNGQVADEVNWNHDKKDGPWKQFFEDGSIKLTATYKNDRLTGNFIAYYPDGKKEMEGNYTDDLPDGEWIHYDQDGKPVSTVRYASGEITNMDEVIASEQEFFKKIEEQKGKIKEPTVEDLMREASKNQMIPEGR